MILSTAELLRKELLTKVMGTCAGTLRWNSFNSSIHSGLHRIALAYGLKESTTYPVSIDRTYQNTYTVVVSGTSILWNGGKDKCLDKIQRFLDEAKVYLMTYDVNQNRASCQFHPN